MSKRSRRKKRQRTKPKKSQPVPKTNEPWLSMRTGLLFMGLLSAVLASYITWQMEPTEGIGTALIWGVGFGVAIWGVFALALAFNRWVRRR